MESGYYHLWQFVIREAEPMRCCTSEKRWRGEGVLIEWRRGKHGMENGYGWESKEVNRRKKLTES